MAEKGRGGCAGWRSLNFYSGFMRFACQRGGEGQGGREGGKAKGAMAREEEADDLMMMYRGRATERRENGRGRVTLTSVLSQQRKKSLSTRQRE